MSQAIAERPDGRVSEMTAFLKQIALDERIDPAKLQALWELRKDIAAEESRQLTEKARVDFFGALAEAQREFPIIQRDAQNPTTHSQYARYETIWERCCPIWTKYGFSVTFPNAKTDDRGWIHLTMQLAHRNGHIEKYEAPPAPPDSTGFRGTANKTPVQGNQSTMSYLKRGLLGNLGIVTANEDDDGAGGSAPATVVQRRGRDMPPLGRDDPIVSPPPDNTMQSHAKELTRWNPFLEKLRDALADAQTEDEVAAISKRPSVVAALSPTSSGAPTWVTREVNALLTNAYAHVTMEAEMPNYGDSPIGEQDGNESGEGDE